MTADTLFIRYHVVNHVVNTCPIHLVLFLLNLYATVYQ